MEFGPALRDAIKTGLCNYLGDVEKGADWVGARYPIDPGPAARAVRRPICNTSDEPEPDPGYTGGQCSTRYDLIVRYIRYTDISQGETAPAAFVLRNRDGPITQFRVTDIRPLGGNPPQWIYDVTITADGVTESVSIDNIQGTGTVEALDIERDDGQPDNCGDPTYVPAPFPPGGVPVPISFTYVNNEGDNVTQLGDFNLFAPVFAPVIAPVTTIYAPIRVNLPDLVFDGTIQLAPDFNINLTPAGGDKSPGTDGGGDGGSPEDPTTAPPTDEDDENEGLLGIHVRSTPAGSPRATQIFNEPGPDLFVPRLCSAFLRVRMGGRLSWLGPIDVKSTSGWVPVPTGTLAVGWDLRPEPGWECTAIPVYGRIPDVEV